MQMIRSSAPRLVLIYAAVAALWIIASDSVLEALIHDPRMLSLAQTSKGWGFVALTSLLLYWLLNREAMAQRKANQRADEVSQEFAAEERRFRQLFENSPLPMWIYDTENLDFLAVNDAAVAHYGYSREEFMKMTIKDIRPLEDVPALLRKIGTRLPSEIHSGRWTHRLKDGSLTEVDIASHELDYLGRPARFVVAYDISQQLRAERALRIAAVVFEECREAIVVADADRRIVMVNNAFRTITGYRTEEAVGQTTALLKSGRHDNAFYQAMWASLNARGFWCGEIWNRRKDGTVYLEWLSISVVTGEDGAIEYYIAIFTDLTDRKANAETMPATRH